MDEFLTPAGWAAGTYRFYIAGVVHGGRPVAWVVLLVVLQMN